MADQAFDQRAANGAAERQRPLSPLADIALDAFIEIDGRRRIIDWNPQAQQIFGWPRSEALELLVEELIPLRNRRLFEVALDALLTGPDYSVRRRTITAVHRDGHEFKIEMAMTALLDEAGSTVVAIARDLTAVRQAEARVLEAERTSQQIINRLEDGYFELDLQGVHVRVNDAYCRFVGRPPNELIGEPYRDFIGDAGRAGATADLFRRVLDTGEPLTAIEYSFADRGGARRFVEDSITLQLDAAGQPAGFIGIRHDCTARKLAATQLLRSEEQYRAVLETIEDGYFEVDWEGRYRFVNEAFCQITGYRAEELIGQSYKMFFPPETIQLLYDAYSMVYRTGQPLKALEYAIVAKDGTEKYVEESVTLKRDPSGQSERFMGIRRDCTARKLAEHDLARARDAAEAGSRAKGEFLANMSHEIRTPMNGIIGMTELVLGTELTPYQAECLSTVKSSALSLLTILNDILDFSKIESHKLEFETVPFSLVDLVNDVLKPLAVKAHQKGLELASDIASDVPGGVAADPGRLKQVLTNLVGNAVKFTDSGEVLLRVQKDAGGFGKTLLRFIVSDTGIGIPVDKHAEIFEAFRQADGSTTRRFGGTGLGLAISATLVRLMGGEIAIHSAPGEGSTFQFAIPFEIAAAVQAPAMSGDAAKLVGMRVLVVDDNAVNRKILETQLTQWRMKPIVVPGGQAALDELARAVRESDPFGLVLLDAQMPHLDGFEVAATIGRRPELAGATIMMLSSGGEYGDVSRCRELGIAAYLTKPVKQSDLLDSISRIVEGTTTERANAVLAAAPSDTALRSLSVLLAEDNIVNQRVATGLLTRRGHSVTVANNGLEVLAALDRHRFDVVLMDVQMPEMGGVEAAHAIRVNERERGGHVPIVAMTAHAMVGDRERCLAAGMDGYLSKPIDPAVLFAAIERGRFVTESAPSVDRLSLLARMGGDEQLMHDVVKMFLTDCGERLAAIRAAIDRADAVQLRGEAHTLKGAAANLSAADLADAAATLEEIGAADTLDGAEAAWGRLTSAADDTLRALRALQESG